MCTVQLECMSIVMKRMLAPVMNSDWIMNMQAVMLLKINRLEGLPMKVT